MYKNLSLISFVGVDINTDLKSLLSFKDSKIKCELGILRSTSRPNDQRYPGFKFCSKFLDFSIDNNLSTSLHLCGDSIDNFLSEDSKTIELCKKAGRIQLNIKISKYDNYNELADLILNIVDKYKLTIILQHNSSKAVFNDIFLSKSTEKTCKFINLLHDSSGGLGKEISEFSAPNFKYFTGYAGGINAENINKIITKINKTNIDNVPFYIDMESSIRIDNLFSVAKCKEILSEI